MNQVQNKWGWSGDAFHGGYLFDNEDRDFLESTSTAPRMMSDGELPVRCDPRSHPLAGQGFLQVENQGQIGSCQGQSLTECAEFCYTFKTGEVIQFSRMFSYLDSQIKDGIRGDSGSTLSGGTKSARDTGFLLESSGKYPPRYPGHQWITPSMRSAASANKLRSHTDLRSSGDVKRYIGSGLGICQIGIPWGRSMTPDTDGFIQSWSGTGGGGHAVVYCGYVPDSDVGRRSGAGYWFLLKNSWDVTWGLGGFALVSPAVVDAQINHRWGVFVGRSDMTAPEPRPLPVDFTDPGGSMYA